MLNSLVVAPMITTRDLFEPLGLGIYFMEQFLNLRWRATIYARANVCVINAFAGRAACWRVRSQSQTRPKSRAQSWPVNVLNPRC